MTIEHVYAIKRGKEFLPKPNSSRMRGGSYVEPVNPQYVWPRVFPELRHAKIYLSIWLKGQIPCEKDWDGDEYSSYYWTYPGKPIPVPTRNREDMEITMLRLHEHRGGDTQFKTMYFLREVGTGKFLTDKFISNRVMGDEAREFDEECVYRAQFFKSYLAAHRYLIKWRRGCIQALYDETDPDAWLSPYGRARIQERDDMVARRKEVDVEIVAYCYKECK